MVEVEVREADSCEVISGHDEYNEVSVPSKQSEFRIKEKSSDESKSGLKLPQSESSKPERPTSFKGLKKKSLHDVEQPKRVVKEVEKAGWMRHIVALLALSSIVLANMNRQAFNQALASMTKQPKKIESIQEEVIIGPVEQLDEPVNSILDTEIVSPDYVDTEPPIQEEEEDRYDWTGEQIALLQSAFSWGYTPFMIPGGRLSEIYGAKWIVFISGFGSALCCLFSPYFADNSYLLLVTSRIAMGLCQTGVSPALYALLTRWLPPEESSIYLPMIKVGVMVGFMSGSLFSGFLTWRMTFYVVGLIGMLWSIMWSLTVTSDPSEHKLVSGQELDYIQQEIGRLNKNRKQSSGTMRKQAAPWLSIATNTVILGFVFTKFTNKLSTDALSMMLPMYLKNVFQMSQEMNGILNATNFAIQGIFTGFVAWTAKEFVVRKAFGMNKTGVRRLFQGICNFGMGSAYFLMTLNMSSLTVVYCSVLLLSISAMFGSGGEAVLPVDLSTDYSASIMAIANSFANLSGVLLPHLVSFVLGDDRSSSDQWNHVWWIVGGVIISGGLTFFFFVEAEIQDFGKKPKKNKLEPNSLCISKAPAAVIEMKYTPRRLS